MSNYFLFFILSFICEVIGTVGGFGSSVFFVPVAGFFFSLQLVLGLTALFHIFSNLSKLIMFGKYVDWKLSLKFGIPAVVFTFLGAYAILYFSQVVSQWFLALFLIFFSLFLWFKKDFQFPATNTSSYLSGIFSGFMAGFTGTGGAIRGMVLAAFNLEKSVFVGTSAAIDMGVDVTRAIVYWQNEFVDISHWKWIIILVLVSVSGTFMGKQILFKISQDNFRKIALFLLFIIGLITLGKLVYVSNFAF